MKFQEEKQIQIPVLMVASAFLMLACGAREDNPGWEYYPDMVHALNPEPLLEYTALPEADTVSRMHPPAGTIPWHRDTFPGGYYLFPFPPGPQGYDSARVWVRNPLPENEQVLAQGREIYRVFCQVCHGSAGDGQGSIVQTGAFPPPPTYHQQRLYEATDGQFFHVLTYGKNLMPSYSRQLSVQERWAVIHYVRFLQDSVLRKTQGISLIHLQDSLRRKSL